MTLSLDDVRSKRFRLARKSGYEVAEVDDFLDAVQESFAQLVEENENLKKQVETLGSDQTAVVPTGESTTAAAEADETRADESRFAEPGTGEPSGVEPEVITVTTSGEASAAVVRLVQLSTEQAERLVSEATEEAERIRADADASATRLSEDTRTEAERLSADARSRADQLHADATARAEQLDRETVERRQQLFGELEQERSSLAASIDQLRHFEQTFRSNLTDHLRRHIDVLEGGHAEPADLPDVPPIAGAVGPATTPAPGQDGDHDAAGHDAAGHGSNEHGSDEQGSDEQGSDQPDSDPAGSSSTAQDGEGDRERPTSETPRLDALLGDNR